MNSTFELSIEVSEPYEFNKSSLEEIEQNIWVKNQWPLVYFIRNEKKKIAYVGESTNASARIRNHLANSSKSIFNQISIIGSDKFNKSATLDIESNLIQYISSEGTYKLHNGNFGLVNHSYYQQDLYKDLFKSIWNKLIEKKIITRSIAEIENTELFKYSPYKSLNEDQYKSILEILNGLTAKNTNTIFVSGVAGTGKTILATYLIKLLNSEVSKTELEEFNDDELIEVAYIQKFRDRYPQSKIGLVIAMTSLRKSLQNVFNKTPGLNARMVLSPSDTFKIKEKYDLLIVDEAHRLRQFKNIGWMGTFRKNNKMLGLNDTGTELDWIIANSKNQIFFYDPAQSIKPSDVDEERFNLLLANKNTLKLKLASQMRVAGGEDYIQFVDELLHLRRKKHTPYTPSNYELLYFDSLCTLYEELGKREKDLGLCRLVAGYSWPWKSKIKKKATDIEIDGLRFQWNKTDKDWVNSPTAFLEIGCIHTTQGYDLNYAGVIFGNEIKYNKQRNKIEIDEGHYFDKYGKTGISDPEDLKAYIINIYKTLMYRGIRGTFVYACNKELGEYLKQHIPTFENSLPFRVIPFDKVKPYVNSVPLIDISAAAGNFSDLQLHSELTWIELPFTTSVKNGYFVCKVVGESMNKIIPNGSYCLFKKDEGGTRNGKIVLVQSTQIQDSDFGSGYTVKEYHSEKSGNDEGWHHTSILLKPKSNNPGYTDILLFAEELTELKVVGIFEKVLTP